MAGKISSDDEAISEINITPFVDVTLVLLIIFMVTAGVMIKKGLNIELPQAATAEQLQNQITFNILVGKNGEILLDGKLTTAEELKIKGADSKAKKEKVVAMISADKGVMYSYVVGVMDTLRQVGVSDFALQLEQLPQQSVIEPGKVK